MDFVHDATAQGRKLRCLNIVDDFTRECLWIETDTSLNGERVKQVLSCLIDLRGKPERLVMDNGPEFRGRVLDQRAYETGIPLDFIDPGKPQQNGCVESFNGKFRDECLSLEWFRSRAEAEVVIEAWRRHYNAVRPHSSLDYLTPAAFAAQTARPAPRHATGRDATVSGACAPRPVASPPRQGHTEPAGATVSS